MLTGGSVNKLGKLVNSVRAFTHAFARPSEPSVRSESQPLIGLALGGGFARGLAHVGILKVLEEEGIPIDFIAGTSVGAVVGAMYCGGVSVKEMTEIAALVRFRDFARWTVSRFGFCSNDRMVPFLAKLMNCSTFEELRAPLAVTATDFITGDPVIFRSGSLIDAIRASCAYPGMFLPVNVNGRMLIDGMLANPVPTGPVKDMGADTVIAVYLSAHWINAKGPRHIFDVIGQCFSIAQQKMCDIWKAHADVVIDPDVTGVAYDAFERAPDLLRGGEQAARNFVPAIKKWLEQPADADLEAALRRRRSKAAASTSPAPAPAPAPALNEANV